MSNVSKKKYNIKKGIIMASESSSSIGTLAGLANALTVAFVILKLCKVITWSWWLVVLVPYCFVLICYAIQLLCCLIRKEKRDE
jgi:hypothetical protein